MTTCSPSTVATSLRVVSMSWPPAERMVVEGHGDGQRVAGADRAGVREALLAVHDPGVVDAELGVVDRPAGTP